MAISGMMGADVDLRSMSNLQDDEILFSESNSRFIITTNTPSSILQKLKDDKVPSSLVGKVTGDELNFILPNQTLHCQLNEMRTAFSDSLARIMEPWQK